MKKNRILKILVVFLMVMIPYNVEAEDSNFYIKLRSVINGADSAIGGISSYCYTYGCRSGNKGVRVSVYEKDGSNVTQVNTKKIDKDSNNYVDIQGVNANIQSGYNTLSTEINNKASSGNLNFSEFCAFNDAFKETYQYKILTGYWSSKYKIDVSASKCKDFKYKLLTETYAVGKTLTQYSEYLENKYIVMEPIISITTSDEKNQTASKAFSTFGINALTDSVMQTIKNKGTAEISNIVSYVIQVMCGSGASESSCRTFVDASESANIQELTNLVTAWNTVVNNFHTKTAESKTVKEWASWIMTGTNYKYVGANSNGKVSDEAKGKGSVSEKIADISWYFHLNKNIGPFKKVNSEATSWKSIQGMTNGYGIIVLNISFDFDLSKYKCIYRDGKLILPEIMPTDITDEEKAKYCCNEVEENGISRWSDYGNGKSELWKKYSLSSEYEKTCKNIEIKDNYCVWNGNNTERYQTVNGNELDCCTYENWGNTNKEREQALKKANKNKTVTKYVFENETTWYSNTCAVPVPQYCTIQKLQNGDTSCCHGLGNYSPSFKDEIKSNGYLVNEAGLQEYLKYKIGVNKYNKLCGAPCSYEIESVCPSCENEDTSYGLVMDKVSGFDSTALQLSKETEKCIFNNNDYLYENNSYCKIYCTEKVEYSLPKRSTLSVTAGTRLVVGGNLSPVESKTTITCRRSEIDTAKFEIDLASKISALKAAYKEYTYASVPLNENKINTTVIGVSKTDTRCECRNYQSGLVDGKCCDSKATHTEQAKLTNTTTFAATDSVQYDYSAPTSSSSCSVQGGTWHYAVYKPEDSCSGGSDCFTKKGNCKAKCKTTIPVKVSDAYCSEYSPRQYCRSGFSLSGGTCVTTSSTTNCSLSGNTWTCKDYSCLDTTSIGSETGKLTSASSFRTTDSNPTCSYAYCSNRNYDRYDFQTVDSYNYAYNKSATQGYQGKICENESGYYQTKYESLKETKKKALLAAWNDYNSVINTLNMCYNFTDRVKSNYKININLSYQNGSYSIDTLLDSNVSQSSDKNFTQTVSTRGYKNCGTMTEVDSLNCEQETQYYTENINGTYAAGTSINTYTYTLPNNSSMYRYVNKSSLSEKDSNINSIYIGPHLPVAYNEKDNKIEVELTPSVVRTNTSGTIYITKTRNDFESEICTDPYKCDAVTPGKTKIVPVYRVIALDSPFPDEDGNGRLTGQNWCSENDCSNTNPVVQKVITNNRGVNENEVYRLTPLYTLVLTPSTVKKIREYNSQTSYGDYNLICEKDTGKYCKSLYLRGEPDKEGNIIDNNLDQMEVLRRDKSCALNENLSGCMPGDYYERGA